MDLASILQSSELLNQEWGSSVPRLQANSKQQENLSDANAALYGIIGDSAALVDNVKQTAELAVQNAKLKGANNFGTNLKDQGEVITGLTADLRNEYALRDQAKASYDSKRGADILSDPLGYISNLFSINEDIANYNSHNENIANRENQIESLNKLTQTTNLTQSQLTESVTEASIAASKNSLLSKAALDANNQRINAATYNSDGIKTALNTSKEILANQFNVLSAQNAQTNIGIAQAHLDLSRQQFEFSKQEKQIADDARAAGKSADQYLIDKINAGGSLRMGDSYDAILPGSVRAGTVLSLLKSNSPAGKQFQEDYLIGDQSEATGTKVLATSPARAIEILATMPVKLAPAQEAVKGVLNQALAATKADPNFDPKNKSAVEASLNARTAAILKSQSDKINYGDSDNVFNIPSIRTLLSNSPTLQQLPVVQKVIAPAIASGLDLNDPNQVFSTVATALQQKTITYPQALELTTLYQVGVKTNLEARQFTSLGMVPSYSYKTQISTDPASVFGGKDVVDLTKPDLVGRALNKFLARQATGSTISSFNPLEIGFNAGVKDNNVPANSGFPSYIPTK